MKSMPKRLLIIACSARKKGAPGEIPALERYDGILFRVLKRWLRYSGALANQLDVLILSAEYGLIKPKTPIPYYNRKMDRARAAELAPSVVAQLAQQLQSTHYEEVFLALGSLYRRAVEPIQAWLAPETHLFIANGGIGKMATQLKRWLVHSGTSECGSSS